MSVLQGKTDQLHPFVVAYYTDTQRMIRDEHWKFVRYPEAQQSQLFDLQNDPSELRNLVAEPAHQDGRNKLDSALTAWLLENGDPNPEN